MRQNIKQEQKFNELKRSQLQQIQQVTLSQKVFQLEVQLHNSEKSYQCIKKPIKNFSKFKRSVNESKCFERNSQVRVRSQKIIPPSLGQNIQPSQKSSKAQNIRLKNVYDAFKQALEVKYKKRMRQFERSVLKINVSKIEENSSPGHQLIYERQDEIKKRFSNKKMDPSIISHLQNLSTSNRQQSIMRTFDPKNNTSLLLDTVEEPTQYIPLNFQKKNSGKKYPSQYYDYLLSTNQQGNFYQVKRKCYTEEQFTQDEENKHKNYNKTRNVSFRLPSQKIKTHKHFIQKIGGITYNLPQILDKLNTTDSNATISYLVKSLRKPQKSQKSQCQRQSITRLQEYRKASQKLTKNQRKLVHPKYHTQSIQSSKQILINDYNEYEYILNNKQILSHRNKSNKKSLKHENKYNKRNVKLNAIGDIQGWVVKNQAHQVQNMLQTINKFEGKSQQNQLLFYQQ